MALLELDPDCPHLWLVHSEPLSTGPWPRMAERLLSPSEKVRRDRYLFEKNRHEYKVTRALIRTVLSRYAPVDPEDWQFDAGPHGKPFVSWPEIDLPLRFNLSNTDGLVACIVALDREVGIDVEELARAARALNVADRFFAPAEVEALHALPEADRPFRFSTYWTLKESYIKARGMGLAIPLDQFSFQLRSGELPAIEIDPRLNDDANRWQFICMKPTRRHLLAAAVERRPADPGRLRFCVRQTVPMVF